MNTASMAQYEYVYLNRNDDKKGKQKATKNTKQKEPKTYKIKSEKEKVRYGNVLQDLLQPLRKTGLLCYTCVEYEYRPTNPQAPVKKSVQDTGIALLRGRFPDIDLASCAPIRRDMLEKQLKLDGLLKPFKVKGDASSPGSLYRCLSRISTGAAEQADTIQATLLEKMTNRIARLQKHPYFIQVLADGDPNKAKNTTKATLKRFAAETQTEGTPLHVYLWSLLEDRVVYFLAADSSASTTTTLSADHTPLCFHKCTGVKKTTSPPVFLAWVTDEANKELHYFMWVAPVEKKGEKTCEDSNENDEYEEEEEEREASTTDDDDEITSSLSVN